jgi:hypothetical protein
MSPSDVCNPFALPGDYAAALREKDAQLTQLQQVRLTYALLLCMPVLALQW